MDSGHWSVLRLMLVSGGTMLAACSGSSTSPPIDTGVPILSVPIVDLAQVNDFLPFGYALHPDQLNPTYELRTVGDTASVRAAGPGTVVNMIGNGQGDWEIHVRPPNAAAYLVIYDHILSVRVAVGQVVVPGQILGRIGPWSPGEGRTELQVNRETGSSAVALCPRNFGTPEFNAAHDAAFTRFPTRGASVCLTNTVQP